MLARKVALWMFPAMICGTGQAYAQTPTTASGPPYPSKPIRIVTTEVGGGSDFAARLVTPGFPATLGQPAIIENRGGSPVIPAEIVQKAPPDGYTLLFMGSTLWIGTLLRDMPYDPVRDYATITWVTRQPNILVVHPSLPVKSVKDLIALAKARPGELNYSTGPTGFANHLAAELFKSMAAINIVRIPYKGIAPALNDLIAGQVQMTFSTAGSAAPHVKSGRLKGLAVTSAEPSALLPGLPTVSATGLPGYESVGITGLFAPAKTPEAIISRLNQEIVRVLGRADVKERLFNAGVEPVGSTPEQFASSMKSEIARLAKVIKDAGIRGD